MHKILITPYFYGPIIKFIWINYDLQFKYDGCYCSKGQAPDYFYQKQVTNLMVAFLGFILTAFFPYKHYANKNIMLLLTVVLVVLFTWVKVAGNGAEEVGSQSWIAIPGLGNFQPSEYAKLFIILYFAAAFYRKAQNIRLKSYNLLKFLPNFSMDFSGCWGSL